jgi:glucosamine--fructose-6-phosphate aminotransferase (isomerizing)
MSVYRKRLKLDGQLFIVISQSGRSDDLIEMTEMANAAGALTAAIVNETESPLAAASKIVLPMAAGLERSIAATKSFVATAAVLLRFVAAWTNDTVFMSAIERLPDRLESAADLEWTSAVRSLVDATSLAIIGRGPTLAIAREAALKLKETSSLHAEGFSSAEFQHGPIALITRHYPVLLFTPTDEAAVGMMELAASLDMKGASVFMTGDVPGLPNRLPTLPPDYPETDALCLVQSFYRLAVRIAEARGYDADQPRHVTKVTRTR